MKWNKKIYYYVGLFFIFLFSLRELIPLGILVRGDLPYYSGNNFKNIIGDRIFYPWSSFESFGKPISLSYDTLFNTFLSFFDFGNATILNGYIIYLPILLLLFSSFFIANKLFDNNLASLLCAVTYIASPTLFGDFGNGQTMWVYAILPIIFYYLYKLFNSEILNIKNVVIFSLSVFFLYAMLPPLLIPGTLSIVIIAIGLILQTPTNQRKQKFKTIFSTTFLSSFIIFTLLLPIFISSTSGQAGIARSSAVDDYRNNYEKTTFVNLFRLAGNEGNGQRTLEYNNFSVTNSFGYIIFAFVIFGIFKLFEKSNRKIKLDVFLRSCSIYLILVIGFIHLITVNTELGSSLFESSWLVGTIRNPTKLYLLLLFPFSLLFVFGVTTLLKKLQPKSAVFVWISSFVLVVLYGWPILSGHLGLFYNREIPLEFNPNQTIQSIANIANDTESRSIIAPTTHIGELNYQVISRSLNTIRGGGLTFSLAARDELKNLINEKSTQTLDALRILGIGSVFSLTPQETDFGYSPFLVELEREILNTHLSKSGLINISKHSNFDQFSVSQPTPLLSTPAKVAYMPNGDFGMVLAARMLGNHTIITSPIANGNEYSTYEFSSQGEPRVSVARHQSNKISQILLNINSLSSTSSILKIRQKDQICTEIVSDIKDIYFHNSEQSHIYLSINNDLISIDQSTTTVDVWVGKNNISIHSASILNGPATNTDNAYIPIYGIIGTGETSNNQGVFYKTDKDGFPSIDLRTTDSISYYAQLIPKNGLDELLLNFNYKNTGKSPITYSVWDKEKETVIMSGTLPITQDWKNASIKIFTDGTNNENYYIYFYAHPGKQVNESSEISNLKFFTLRKILDSSFIANSYLNSSLVECLNETISASTTSNNLVPNSSFEDSQLWEGFGTIPFSEDNEHAVKITQNNESVESKHSIQIETQGKTTYIWQTIDDIPSASVYRISFFYKTLNGQGPSFGIWQEGPNLSSPKGDLIASSTWQKFETFFVPDKDTEKIAIYLYSNSLGVKTVNLFDHVKIEKVTNIQDYLSIKSKDFPQNLELIEYKQLNPVLIKAKLKGGNGLILFNESYHSGWKLFIDKSPKDNSWLPFSLLMPNSNVSQVPTSMHTVVNGFANGWLIDDSTLEDYQIYIVYWPYIFYIFSLYVSVTSLSVCISYLIYDFVRRRKNRVTLDSEGF